LALVFGLVCRRKIAMVRKVFVLGMSAAAFAGAASFHMNYAGYDVKGPKSLVVESSANLANVEYAFTRGGEVVLNGAFGTALNPDNWASGPVFYSLDFSKLTAAGEYTLTFKENGSDVTAKINVVDDAMAKDPLSLVLKYFRLDRSTMGHTSVAPYGGSNKLDVHGGWSDASGDYGKYLSHLSYANYLNPQQTPLTVWALAFAAERIPNKVKSATGDANFALDEAVYGADFLVRMLDEAGFFYMTVFNGWQGMDMGWQLCAFSGSDGRMDSKYQTAYRQGGGMAIAGLARVSTLKKNGDFSSAVYLESAKKAFEHLESKQTIGGKCEYCNNGDGVENIIDDYTALMAASELYNATQSEAYLSAARARAEHLVGRLSTDGYFWSDNDKTRPFWHASDAGLPLVALVRYLELEKDRSKAASVKTAVRKHLNWLIAVTDRENNPFGYAKQTYKTGGSIKTGYFIPHDNESNYWWQGENARLGSLASAAVYAARILDYADSAKAQGYAADQVDWILGKNPYDVSFMKGIGSKNPRAYQDYGSTTFAGGIANGITGKSTDGSGIVWDNVEAAGFVESWQYWRWVEQWLPHSTWFMMALATRYDEAPVKIDNSGDGSTDAGDSGSGSSSGSDSGSDAGDGSVRPTSIQVAGVDVTAQNVRLVISQNSIQVVAPQSKMVNVKIADARGVIVYSGAVRGNSSVDISRLNKGIYLVTAGKSVVKKFAVR